MKYNTPVKPGAMTPRQIVRKIANDVAMLATTATATAVLVAIVIMFS